MTMVSFTIKAGQTFALGFRVLGLDRLADWTAACELRDPDLGTFVGMMQTMLTEAADFADTGARLLALRAEPAETQLWLVAPDVDRTLHSDVKITSSTGEVVVSSTFIVSVQKRVTQ